MNPKEEKCTVIENRNIGKNYFFMKLKADYISSEAKPGNFIMLAPSRSTDPLLKRPFGILHAEKPYIWLYYETVGRGTELISGFQPGEEMNAIGPLGNEFPTFKNRKILLVAGGRGIVPIYFAAESYSANSLGNEVYLIYGAKSGDDLNLLEHIDKLGLKQVYLYTDDGSSGKKGFVTTDIRQLIEENGIEITISCGPDAMFENLSEVLTGSPTENYVSLEAWMGCGFGICYSCAVKTVNGDYKKVCTDGPVFKMEEIAW